MEINPVNDLRKAYKTVSMIGVVMMMSLLVYAAVVEYIQKTYAPFTGFSPFPEVGMLRNILLVVALAEVFMIRGIKKLVLSGKLPVQGNAGATSMSPAVQRLFSSSIIIFALSESIAIYGLVLFLIAGNSSDFYTFMALSLISYVIYFPKFSQWEEWMKEAERVRRR